jgi:hypothetical protein
MFTPTPPHRAQPPPERARRGTPPARLRIPKRLPDGIPARVRAPLAIAAGAVVLRVLSGVGFANYDTLYALVWGQQAARGETPQYGIPVAPTPHPLVEALGFVTAPVGPRAMERVAVALGFLALSACGWAVYRLGALWFNRPAGALAAAILLTRVPVLSDGVRAYVDLPYLALVLGALVVETRRARAGAPVLALLALAGLLRPEAWVFSGGYWVYLFFWSPRRARNVGELAWLAMLALAAPIAWVASDWIVTGDAVWSLTNTRHTAEVLGRETGIAKVPEYVPRRIGEVLGPAVLVGAAIGGVMSLVWLRRRALPGAIVGVAAVAVFAAFATVGLPINTRYAFLAAAILCVFCGAAVCGWALLPPGHRGRRWWGAAAVLVTAGMLATAPAQYHTDHHELQALARQQRIQDALQKLVGEGAITARCEPVGVSNHAPIPLLALWLETPPAEVVSAQVRTVTNGTYVDPANEEVQRDYVLNQNDPHEDTPESVPPGFTATRTSGSWLIFQRCSPSSGG